MRHNSFLARLKQYAIANTLVAAGHYTRPAFIHIGVARAGSTSLWAYLCLHPQVRRAIRKEIHYFDNDRFYRRGVRWYHSMFPLPSQMEPGQISFDSTPRYIYKPEAPDRIYRYDPKIKLILVLRNPVERAYSAWNQPTEDQQVKQHYTSFDEMVRNELQQIEKLSSPYELRRQAEIIQRGLYHPQVERYFRLFPREQLLILENEELRDNTVATIRRVAYFVGLREHAWENENFEPQHKSSSHETIHPETRKLLTDFYRPHNEKLYNQLGMDLGWG